MDKAIDLAELGLGCQRSQAELVLKGVARRHQAAIFRAQFFVYNSESRHIYRKHNTIRQLLSNEVITIDFMVSKIT